MIFHFSDVPTNFSANHDSVAFVGLSSRLNSVSVATGILFKLTVPVREMRVVANVALRAGSSQQGKACRAAVGYAE